MKNTDDDRDWAWTLSVRCPVCRVGPGQPCATQRVPFHASRIDKGHAIRRREQVKRARELELLL